MMREVTCLKLEHGWKILQDVHDQGEHLGLYRPDFHPTVGNQISDWEELKGLKHLQLIYSDNPYFGRELRYFNDAPWWYRYDFDVSEDAGSVAVLKFTNVDYYCKIWLNGIYVGYHEGYTIPFSFRVEDKLLHGRRNTLIVKVWSPWDDAVDGNKQESRTFLISRRMVKGTYEHSDTFVQRDVNPVGIYGSVELQLCGNACFDGRPDIDYTLNDDLTAAKVTAVVKSFIADTSTYTLRLSCTDKQTHVLKAVTEIALTVGKNSVEMPVENIRLWNTWDKGGVWLYSLKIEILKDGIAVDADMQNIGFRKIEMFRDEKTTRFFLNNKPFYVRGSSYFPDLYVSNMCYERYKRDLLNVKAAGFNLLRIHVHIEQPVFYELCTELGIGIMQDSEYNWMHPVSDAFADRFIKVYLESVRMLKRHSSMFCWICMNEPGLEDPMGGTAGRAMTVNPGPRLYAAVGRIDSSRPAIKGSFCENDLSSGDSHNYSGSLNGEGTSYWDIYGTSEKFNTEYGFDAPPCEFSLRNIPRAYRRLAPIMSRFNEIGEYQYKLLKYFTEHYRLQKYAPNSGYVQFLFSDMCPQSFYGIYDWWGLPKRGLDAMLESNQPIGVFLKYGKDEIEGVYAVNDSLSAYDAVEVELFLTNCKGDTILSEKVSLNLDADGIKKVYGLDIKREDMPHVNCALVMTKGNTVFAANYYEDLFVMPEHIKGHPSRMDHELGMRLYFAD